jgi:hypothetical protein
MVGQGKGKPKKRIKKTMTKEDLEVMFQYMIETAPRLNEIAPSESTVKANEKFARKEAVEEPTEYARDIKDTKG